MTYANGASLVKMKLCNHPILGREATYDALCTPRISFREQVSFLRRQFFQDGELPFTNVLTEEVIAQALTALSACVDRIFSPWSRCESFWDRS